MEFDTNLSICQLGELRQLIDSALFTSHAPIHHHTPSVTAILFGA